MNDKNYDKAILRFIERTDDLLIKGLNFTFEEWLDNKFFLTDAKRLEKRGKIQIDQTELSKIYAKQKELLQQSIDYEVKMLKYDFNNGINSVENKVAFFNETFDSIKRLLTQPINKIKFETVTKVLPNLKGNDIEIEFVTLSEPFFKNRFYQKPVINFMQSYYNKHIKGVHFIDVEAIDKPILSEYLDKPKNLSAEEYLTKGCVLAHSYYQFLNYLETLKPSLKNKNINFSFSLFYNNSEIREEGIFYKSTEEWREQIEDLKNSLIESNFVCESVQYIDFKVVFGNHRNYFNPRRIKWRRKKIKQLNYFLKKLSKCKFIHTKMNRAEMLTCFSDEHGNPIQEKSVKGGNTIPKKDKEKIDRIVKYLEL